MATSAQSNGSDLVMNSKPNTAVKGATEETKKEGDSSIVEKPNQANVTAAAGQRGMTKVASKAALQQQKGLVQQVSKANMRNLAQQSKQDMIIKKRLLREKQEMQLKGGYNLIYPFVTYEEEELIKEKVASLRAHGHTGKSVKS